MVSKHPTAKQLRIIDMKIAQKERYYQKAIDKKPKLQHALTTLTMKRSNKLQKDYSSKSAKKSLSHFLARKYAYEKGWIKRKPHLSSP